VVEVAGWQQRGKEFPSRPDICVRHWTAGPTSGRTPSLGVVTKGRGGEKPLPGPLCQIYQSREPDGNDIIFLIASGIANHAGKGVWQQVSGNARSMGLEIEWSGPGESFSAGRKAIAEQAMAALMECALGTNPDDACEHREYATPAGRKIDTNLDGDELRRRMRELMGQPAATASPTIGTVRAGGGAEHVVQPGENLTMIARKHGIALARLLELNPQFKPDPNVIHPGDIVRLP